MFTSTTQLGLNSPGYLRLEDYSAIGERAHIYNLGKVTLGQRVTISQGSHICAGSHDHESDNMQLLCSPIKVADDAWICADAFVGPGVSVGTGSVVGARAAVFRNVEAWTVVGGNPAALIRKRRMRSKSEL